MTAETRTTITLGDIAAIEYECQRCKAKMIKIVKDERPIPVSCSNCNSPWFADGDLEHKHLKSLIALLTALPPKWSG